VDGWERLKKLTVKKVAAPDSNSAHPQSILAFPVAWKGEKIRRKLAGSPNTLSNHDRVIRGRAKRMGLTVEQYQAKYPRLS